MPRTSSLRRTQPLTPMTFGLLGINFLVFLIEIRAGGSTNLETLRQLGGLVPPAVWQQEEWWRVISANFLHSGWIHLSMNMFSLFLLGRLVERWLGMGRFLLVYLLSGIGAMTAFAIAFADNQEIILVGASAAIMGLVGVIVAQSWLLWVKTRTLLARRRLVYILGILLLQFSLDWLFPQISFSSHLFGLLCGFAIAYVILDR
ncbi:MAG: rhomboid family intramembrane serine protease [Cyanobacteria bacterium P01_H01_bin.15]